MNRKELSFKNDFGVTGTRYRLLNQQKTEFEGEQNT